MTENEEIIKLLREISAKLDRLESAIDANTKSTYDAIRYWSH
jgi:hypothetical protein